MRYDTIIVGGSYAGIAAALQLVRARRSVLVIDAGQRRNRFASHSHGFLGQDGVPPEDIAANARRQLAAYPSLSWLEGRATAVTGSADAFTVTTSDGGSHRARRILLATGVADRLPRRRRPCRTLGHGRLPLPVLPRLRTRPGPHRHRRRQSAVRPPGRIAHRLGRCDPARQPRAGPDRHVPLHPRATGVAIEEAPIDRIEGHADVVMADGRQLRFAGLFTATRTSPSSPLAEAMGCVLEDTPMGTQVRTDAENKTSVAGVFRLRRRGENPPLAVPGRGPRRHGGRTGPSFAGVARNPRTAASGRPHAMTPFSDPAAVSGYAARTVRIVPGLHDLHRMAGVLLAEQALADARILVLGAGGGLELKAFAEMQPAWRFDGVDPSAEMLGLARTTLGPLAPRVHLHEGYIDGAPAGPFDGATCLLTLHFLPANERLRTLQQLRARLRPGAPLVVAHHSFDSEISAGHRWLARNAAFAAASGVPTAQAEGSIAAIRQRLPVLSPQQDADQLREAGFTDIELFYCAFTFKGWVARAGSVAA